MLILDVKEGKKIIIGAGETKITIACLGVDATGQIKLGFDAPKNVAINREVVYEQKMENVRKVMEPE